MSALSEGEHRGLLEIAKRIRHRILRIVFDSGSGHVGAALSQTDLLVALYHKCLRIDPAHSDAPDRDRFVLSKGHGGLGLAAVLADLGFFPLEDLRRFGETGFQLGMHMDHTRVAGVEASTGSLGHGLGMAVGMALGAHAQKQSWRTYCLISDGELYEGSIWEAAIAAAGFGLGRLTVLVDRNKLTMDGFTEALMPLEPIAEKWSAFGWRSYAIDGHDLNEICECLETLSREESTRPAIVIANTVKGQGVDFMEAQAKWHYGALDTEMFARAQASIDAHYTRLGLRAGERP